MKQQYYRRKATVEESANLSIFRLKALGLLQGHCSSTLTWTRSKSGQKTSVAVTVDVLDEPYVNLSYTLADHNSGNTTDYDYDVSLDATACNFGGERYWFVCPSCGVRAGVLYRAPGNEYFWCRDCSNLSYRSRNCSGWEQLCSVARRVETLQSKVRRQVYRGKPIKKVQKLLGLQRKAEILSQACLTSLEARFKRN